MFVSAIIAAAGRGARLGGHVPKQWITIGGRTLLERTIDVFDRHPRVNELILVLPPEDIERAKTQFSTETPAHLVGGGSTRQESVANGFGAVSSHADIVLVHDAARPFVTPAVIDRTIDGARTWGAVIPAIPVHDTVKDVTWADGARRVVGTQLRDGLALAQTPQGFRREVLASAIAAGDRGVTGTDESMLAEAAGHEVHVVEGDPRNVKITTQEDLALARAVLSGRPTMRIGLGYDSHRFTDDRPLRLAGVLIPGERGLSGYSDADAVCHAVTDAVLGAAGLGDIGTLFPDTDSRWKDADSLDLLRLAWARVRDAGWTLGNLDVVVICDRPKLAAHRGPMQASLARALDADPSAIAIKGKTPEGISALADAIVVHAVALLTVL
jgi:2-C-methyl-D-erythritol 4-phosphate cytidylyltransferase / 2-C-methyl-D-erythritol 2,4-cyclodiphosphate synthase